MSTAVASPGFMCKLTDRKEVAEATIAFRFEKPSGWTFKAGQFIDMTLLDPSETDSEGNTRGFSIASGPHEETLMVATRTRDTAFKRVLKSMPLGTAVKVEGPFGNFTLHNNAARTRRVPLRWYWHHAVPLHSFSCSEGKAPPSYLPFLFEPAPRGRSLPRRAAGVGTRESELQARRNYDPNGEIEPALARQYGSN